MSEMGNPGRFGLGFSAFRGVERWAARPIAVEGWGAATRVSRRLFLGLLLASSPPESRPASIQRSRKDLKWLVESAAPLLALLY